MPGQPTALCCRRTQEQLRGRIFEDRENYRNNLQTLPKYLRNYASRRCRIRLLMRIRSISKGSCCEHAHAVPEIIKPLFLNETSQCRDHAAPIRSSKPCESNGAPRAGARCQRKRYQCQAFRQRKKTTLFRTRRAAVD